MHGAYALLDYRRFAATFRRYSYRLTKCLQYVKEIWLWGRLQDEVWNIRRKVNGGKYMCRSTL